MKKRTIKDIANLLVYIVGIVIIFNFVGGHTLRIVNISLIYAIVALGLVVMLGMTGMLSFAGVSFMGIGAYVVANLCTGRHGVEIGSLPSVLLAILLCGIIGGLIGMVLLRLNGNFFTFATIALVQIFQTLFINYVPLFGGSSGISGIPTFSIGDFQVKGYKAWFIFVAVVVGVVALLVERMGRTRVGRALYSIRDDEIVANSLGINVYRTKLIAFVIQAMLGGLAGALYAMQNSYIGSDIFTWVKATSIVIMAMVGGINSPLGTIIGAIIVTALPEIFRNFQQYLRLIYGIAIILLMVFMPSGIMGIGSTVKSAIDKSRRKRTAQKNLVNGGSTNE